MGPAPTNLSLSYNLFGNGTCHKIGHAEIQNRTRRSAGGFEASITEYPFMASIRYAGEAICGGSIIYPDVILTAAHCMRDIYFLDLLYVKVGDSDINFRGSWHQVAKVLKHEKYQELNKKKRMMNDIALLKLKEPIKIDNRTTRTIQLLKGSDNARNYESGTLPGWGYCPTIVNKTVPNPNDQTCSELAPQDNLDIQFCTHTLGRLPCKGDSGSPLVVNGKQGGIESWGIEDCSADANTYHFIDANTDYFTDVAKFTKWIDEKMKIL
ncbi:hypothetical protein QAD02_011499 [Eretmocerus hayati]|uniref:Uncharacterized protein n=1 Tax=Eretmocerus hayati TaxID=131215 RepID=A0ACC2NWX2_9HYME|nr:hypothetical protein QAD02_011499 [Eretmocerus hayati]